MVIKEKAVAVVVLPDLEVEAGEHLEDRRFGFPRVDATTVIDHPQLRAGLQRPILQYRHIWRKA